MSRLSSMLGCRTSSRVIVAVPRPPENIETTSLRTGVIGPLRDANHLATQQKLPKADVGDEERAIDRAANGAQARLAFLPHAVLDGHFLRYDAQLEQLGGHLGRVVQALGLEMDRPQRRPVDELERRVEVGDMRVVGEVAELPAPPRAEARERRVFLTDAYAEIGLARRVPGALEALDVLDRELAVGV